MFTQSPRRRHRPRGRSLGPALIIESGVWLAFVWWVLHVAPASPSHPLATGTAGSDVTIESGNTNESGNSPKIGSWIANRSSHNAATYP